MKIFISTIATIFILSSIYGQESNKQERNIFTTAEEMPRFPGCENAIGLNRVKSKCATEKLLTYAYENLIYPEEAKKQKIEGLVVVKFIVNMYGDIEEPIVITSLGYGCDEEVIRLVEEMNNMSESWTPGKQRGRKVDVYFTLPIRFKLK